MARRHRTPPRRGGRPLPQAALGDGAAAHDAPATTSGVASWIPSGATFAAGLKPWVTTAATCARRTAARPTGGANLWARSRSPSSADVSLPPASAAGTVTLYDPLSARVIVSHIRISTDTAQRIIVGTADTNGTRMAGGWLPAGGAGILADLALDTQATSIDGPAHPRVHGPAGRAGGANRGLHRRGNAVSGGYGGGATGGKAGAAWYLFFNVGGTRRSSSTYRTAGPTSCSR